MYCFQMKAIVILEEGSVFCCESMRGLVKDSWCVFTTHHPVYGGFIVIYDVYGNLVTSLVMGKDSMYVFL